MYVGYLQDCRGEIYVIEIDCINGGKPNLTLSYFQKHSQRYDENLIALKRMVDQSEKRIVLID